VIIIAVQGLIAGAIQLVQAFQGGGWGVGLLGVLGIILGIVLLASPVLAATALPWVLGIFSIVGGIAAIIGSFSLR
jgi:uncharacterized membrane protein HdeD (DUF308 family)